MRKYLLTFCFAIILLAPARAQYSTAGTDFWFGFLENFGGNQLDAQLYVTSPVNTTCTVTLANGSYTNTFPVAANVLLNITVPAFNNPFVINDQVIENQAIHITSAAPVSVYAANIDNATVDATVIYPTTSIGNNYRVAVYNPSNLFGAAAEILIVAAENNTDVEIIPAATTLQGNAAGVPFTVTLQQGQTYMVQSTADLTGTTIKATGVGSNCKKFSVFGGNQCASIPNIGAAFVCCCDHICEQIPDVNRWGSNFSTSPLATRNGDTYIVMAHTNGTVVNVSGVGTYNLNAGQFAEFITAAPAKWISSNNPILVAQYANSQDYDFAAQADPFYIILPPVEQATSQAIFGTYSTPLTNDYYVNVVTKTVNTPGGILLDGVPIPAGSYTPCTGNPAYSFAAISITAGSHTLFTDSSFIATTYAWGQYESYGYLAGANLIDLLAQPNIVFNSDTSLFSNFTDSLDCQNTTITLFIDSTTSVINVSWNFGDNSPTVFDWNATHTYSSAGSYVVTMYYGLQGGCSTDSVTFPVEVVTSTSSLDIMSDTTLCPGDLITWNVPTANLDTITWYDGTHDTTKTVGPGYYTAVYSTNGCPGADTATVSVFNLSTAGLPPDFDMCFPDTVILDLTATQVVSYLWQDGSTDSTYLVNQPGTYFVDVELSNCHIYDTVNVAQQYLNINLLPDTAWFCIGADVEVVANLSNGTYLWSTGGTGQGETFSSVTTASLIASQNGCTALDTIDIKEVTCYCNFFVPNTFTPNNDHKNETFFPSICSELNFYTMRIFNRWGQEIFVSDDPSKGWDGKHSGKDCPIGIYSYVINYDSYAVFEDEKTIRGHINLVR
jgi:gliding motility-associated-like protein